MFSPKDHEQLQHRGFSIQRGGDLSVHFAFLGFKFQNMPKTAGMLLFCTCIDIKLNDQRAFAETRHQTFLILRFYFKSFCIPSNKG